MSSVVVTTPDVVGERMAGPGIRAWHFARELARHTSVTLIAKTERSTIKGEGFDIIDRDSPASRHATDKAAILVGQPARGFRRIRRGQKIIFDLFDPTVLELRELYGSAPSIRQRIHVAAEWARLSEALMTADLLVCATARQRRFYERLQSNDASWIEVPFGLDLADARVCAKPQDNVVVWGGGVWEWLDPATAVDAVLRVNADGVRCKLLFLGTTRPNQSLIDRRRDDRFRLLLERGGPHVSANADWIRYRERLSWLRSGKIAIMLHRPTGEAEFSIRTRLFDAMAAGIPVIATRGGFAADIVEREGLGLVVPPSDVEAVAGAIKKLLLDDVLYARSVVNLERVRPDFAWDVVTRPLIEAVSTWLKQQ
jgi:glycosyltransferase involved in cell wall biosynthesis